MLDTFCCFATCVSFRVVVASFCGAVNIAYCSSWAVSILGEPCDNEAVAAFTLLCYNYACSLQLTGAIVVLLRHQRMKSPSPSALLCLLSWEEGLGELPNTSVLKQNRKKTHGSFLFPFAKLCLLEVAHLFPHLTGKIKKVFVPPHNHSWLP